MINAAYTINEIDSMLIRSLQGTCSTDEPLSHEKATLKANLLTFVCMEDSDKRCLLECVQALSSRLPNAGPVIAFTILASIGSKWDEMFSKEQHKNNLANGCG